MNYTNVTNPQWATADHSSINCIVDFEQQEQYEKCSEIKEIIKTL
jgi:hypothetical protein